MFDRAMHLIGAILILILIAMILTSHVNGGGHG